MKTTFGSSAVVTMLAMCALAACDESSAPAGAPTTDGPDSGTVTGEPDSGIAVVSECTPPTGTGTRYTTGSIQDETFTAAGSPHILAADTTVYGTLTLEPCAELLIEGAKSITVRSTGKIVAAGTPTRRIHIGAADPAKPFSIITSVNGSISLSYVTIDGGGDPLNAGPDGASMLEVRGDQTMPTQGKLFVDHVSIAGSKSIGVLLREGAGFAAGSTDLEVSGSANYPVSIWARSAGTLPSGKYTGNARDEILLPIASGFEAMTEDATIRDRGVPYHVGAATSSASMRITGDAAGSVVPTITIEAGVVMKFKKGGALHVEFATGTTPARSALRVLGTAQKRVVFTSAEPTPAAGDWLGIWFGLEPLAANKIDYARVEYAGGGSGSGSDSCVYPNPINNDAAIRVRGKPAGGAFVTNTILSNSARHGIDRGFRSDAKIDFTATNTFEGIAACRQSYPRDENGACPDPVPCD